MRNYFLKSFILLLTLTILQSLTAQNFKGKIIDKNSEPIIGSSVLIKEVNQGLACNDNGEFQTNLKVGTYTVEYRCMGYESVSENITIKADEILSRSISLKEKAISLKEVTVSKMKDPAYEIMQNAIDKAPYHQNRIKEYEAESYIKGNMELTKVNKLIDKFSGENGIKMSDYKGNLFVQESYNDIKFIAPDKYEQTVKAFSSSAPDDFDPKNAIPLLSSSLYLPRFSGLISPLNPKAFNCYNFRYEGYLEEDGEFINIIKITPKMKDPELMEGYLHIADQSWDIRYADLTGSMFGINQHFTITYDRLQADVYLPTTFSNRLEGSVFGIEGYFVYHSSMKYNHILLNESPLATIEELKKKKSLEIKRDDKYNITSDTLSTKRDSAYWAQIRNLPLDGRELKSFIFKDSIQQHFDSVRKTHVDAKFKPIDLLTGGKIGGDSAKFELKYGGLLGVLRDYNFVDGFGLGQRFELSTRLKNNNRLELSPEIYYTTARKNISWKTDLSLEYAPMRIGQATVSVGDIATDFNPVGIEKLDNAINSVVWGRNKRMLYRQKHIKIENEIDLTNGLRLRAQIGMEDRSPLENNTTYNFFGGKSKIKTNLQDPLHSDLLYYKIGLEYTPERYYCIINGRKEYRQSRFPTFNVVYNEGFSSIKSDNARFRKIEGGIHQYVKTGVFSSIMYQAGGGKFLGNNDRMNFADYKHFSTADDLWMTTKSPLSSFMLLDAYGASTNSYWIQSQVNYYSKYILLKRLPFLQGKLFNEALHLKYLYTPNKKNYMEAGYSLDLFSSLSLGVHCSFDNFKYDSFGVKLSYNFNLLK